MTHEEAIRELTELVEEAEDMDIPYAPALRIAITALKQDKWISVEEELPEICKAVLVFTPKYQNVWAAYLGIGGKWNVWAPGIKDELSSYYGEITHWRPIPQLVNERDF